LMALMICSSVYRLRFISSSPLFKFKGKTRQMDGSNYRGKVNQIIDKRINTYLFVYT